MSEPTLDPELAALSAALGALAPAVPALDRDRLFFEAGRRAARPPRRGWPLATCGFAILSAALGWRLANAPVPGPVERTVVVQAPAKTIDAPTPAPRSSEVVALEPRPADAPYLRMRDQVLRFGADSLPNLPPTAPEPPEPPERVRGLPDNGRPSLWFFPIF